MRDPPINQPILGNEKFQHRDVGMALLRAGGSPTLPKSPQRNN